MASGVIYIVPIALVGFAFSRKHGKHISGSGMSAVRLRAALSIRQTSNLKFGLDCLDGVSIRYWHICRK